MKNRPPVPFRPSAGPPTYTKMEKDDEDETKGGSLRAHGGGEGGGAEAAVVGGCCGEGRVWIFLVLGVLTLVFSGVLVGIYMNVKSLTSSMDVIEVMPSFIPAAAGGLTGLFLLTLFWRRHTVLVYPVLILCAVSTGLSIIISVLTGTHVLQPLLSVSGCVYTRKSSTCQCLTQFKRDKLDLERVNAGETIHLTLYNVSSCEDVQTVIPTMLYTMIGIHGLLALVSAVAGIISFLVYRTEHNRSYMEDYEDDEDSSPSTPSSNSDNYTEQQTMLTPHQTNTTTAASMGNIYTNTNATTNDEDATNDDGNTTPSDLVYTPTDAPMGYAEACKMRRCQSFSQPGSKISTKEGSPESSESSQTASSLIVGERVAEGGALRLKDNRKKGRRAVTLHGLDREQLLLILSLQMRYLQESEQVKKEHKSALNLTNGPVSSINSGAAASSDTSQDNMEASHTFSRLQRRAMTPTPRQERLSSSRAPNDELEYKTAKLVRSHTPQPYHFKSQPTTAHQSLYNGCPMPANIPADYQLQQLQQLQLLQQQQKVQHQLQHQQHLEGQVQFPLAVPVQQQILLQQPVLQTPDDNPEGNEPLTMITYDLRSVQTTGPIVYENIPSSRTSISYYSPDGSCSSNSSSLLRASNYPVHTGMSATGHLLPLPPHPNESNQLKVSGGITQSSPPSQISRQASEASSSSPSCTESASPESKSNAKSKEGTPETPPGKTKSKKKLSKKEKNAKKEEDKALVDAATKPTSLGRTDSNSSKTVPDRWQAVLPDGKAQAQTLWENVQRKIVSDPQTPDSTLTFPHSSHSQSSAQTQSLIPNASLTVPNGILKNSKSGGYSQQSDLKEGQMEMQSNSSYASQNQDLYPVYSYHKQVSNPNSYNAFIPIATSSTDNYEDIDNDFATSHRHGGPTQKDVPPPKPARLYARKVAAENAYALDSQGQQLRPKSYLSAVDRENMAAGHLNNLSNVPTQPGNGGTDKKSSTHLQMEGPVRDERSAGHDEQFIMINGDLYAQPRRKSIPNNLPLAQSSQPSHQLYPNPSLDRAHLIASQHQARGQYSLDPHRHQRSAFHTLGPVYHGDRSGHLSPPNEICDTDLDDLPIPRWNSRYQRSQSFSPPPYAPPPVYQSGEAISKYPSIRSASSSSSDPHNSSSESAVMDNVQTGFVNGRYSSSINRGRQPVHLTDRRFCLTQQRQPLHQNATPLDYLGQPRHNTSGAYESFRDRREFSDPPHVAIRRCQSVEEGNRKRLPPGQLLNQEKLKPNSNIYPIQDTARTGHSKENQSKLGPPVNRVRPIHSGLEANSEQSMLQKGIQTFQNDVFIRGNACQTRRFPGDVSEEDLSCSLDTDSVSDSSPQDAQQQKELKSLVPVGQHTESSDSDKDEYAETVI